MEDTDQTRLNKILRASVVGIGLVCIVVSSIYLHQHPEILDKVLEAIKSVVTQFLIS